MIYYLNDLNIFLSIELIHYLIIVILCCLV